MLDIPQIDEQVSRDNARKLLKQYRRLSRIAGRPLGGMKTIELSDIPHSHSNVNGAERATVDAVSQRVEACNLIEQIQQTLTGLPDNSKAVLYYSYCTTTPLSRFEIADVAGLGNESVVNYQKRLALVEFAEAFPTGELLVYK